MRSASALLLAAAAAAGCGGHSEHPPVVSAAVPAGDNVVPLALGAPYCSHATSYKNKPCLSVTVCEPGTTTCQTVGDLLLDTGSVGLRIFKQALTAVTLPQAPAGAGSLAECVQYADGSADWGPVKTADVILGGMAPVRVPIQVVDATFGSVPASCGTPEASPADAGFNGILGVGLWAEDCGPACNDPRPQYFPNGWYYSCTGSSCADALAPTSQQVQNPVAHLPADFQGVVVDLPAVPAGGASSATGSLILGIGSRANNAPGSAVGYPASGNGYIDTVFDGSTLSRSFIDSGSNGLFFASPPPASANHVADCTAASGWFCPASTMTLPATIQGTAGTPSAGVSFEIGNAESLFSSGNAVFHELGGGLPPALAASFDWGLPFFLGRRVYIGIEGAAVAGLGTGPYYAY